MQIIEELPPIVSPEDGVPASFLADCIVKRAKYFGSLKWRPTGVHHGYLAYLTSNSYNTTTGVATFRQLGGFIRMIGLFAFSDRHVRINKLLDGCSSVAASCGMDWPSGFEPSKGQQGFFLKLRIDKGFVSVHGDYKGVNTFMVGVPGIGWIQAPPGRLVALDKCRPGAVLNLVGLSRFNGKLPSEWTKEHYDRAAIKILECGR